MQDLSQKGDTEPSTLITCTCIAESGLMVKAFGCQIHNLLGKAHNKVVNGLEDYMKQAAAQAQANDTKERRVVVGVAGARPRRMLPKRRARQTPPALGAQQTGTRAARSQWCGWRTVAR